MGDDYVRTDNLCIQKGDDRPFSWPIADVNGEPLGLGGFTAKAQVRARANSTQVLHEWSTTNGRAVVGDGAVTLLVNDSEDWQWDRGVYDIHLVDPEGNVEVVARGTVVVIAGVTR